MAQHRATQQSIKRELLALIHQGFAKDKAANPYPESAKRSFFLFQP
jgi:hypothetical protein